MKRIDNLRCLHVNSRESEFINNKMREPMKHLQITGQLRHAHRYNKIALVESKMNHSITTEFSKLLVNKVLNKLFGYTSGL